MEVADAMERNHDVAAIAAVTGVSGKRLGVGNMPWENALTGEGVLNMEVRPLPLPCRGEGVMDIGCMPEFELHMSHQSGAAAVMLGAACRCCSA